ncbi:hypothetical protein B0H13DRAFT_2281522 [Mycena leptocephala]|nr:hypothetical protein B0H13DRAFT_2281522 [Mycena leptocephala]
MSVLSKAPTRRVKYGKFHPLTPGLCVGNPGLKFCQIVICKSNEWESWVLEEEEANYTKFACAFDSEVPRRSFHLHLPNTGSYDVGIQTFDTANAKPSSSHWFDYDTPVAETMYQMQTLNNVIKAGFVRHIETTSALASTFTIMASPFAPQLGTNYCPTDDEVGEIKAFLIEPTLRLKRLDDEISDPQRAIDKLRAERESLGADVKAHRALISPVRRLPLDIIQEVFVACLPTHHNCVMSGSEPPILLGRICSFWRTISLSTPRLWTSLHVVEPTRPPPDSNTVALFERKHTQRLETMKDWLGRSGNCPLSISLEGALYLGIGTVQSLGPCLFLQALIPFVCRWRTINFTAQAPRLTEALSHLTESDVPILQDLVMHERPANTIDPVISPPVNTWASTTPGPRPE